MAIRPDDLIAKFQYALDDNWGYIWGQAGATWTEAKQKAATRDMTKQYGAKWIGHRVADCSGLFTWAFKELGGTMYHGSNTMYKSYCTAKGKLSGGKRTDGVTLKPGTAVFTGSEDNHGHVGLYVGNGLVIEAQGTKAGVVTSKVTLSKWTFWGELKGVDYSLTGTTAPAPTPVEDPTNTKSALVIGTRLALRTAPSTAAEIIMRVDTGERVQLLDDTEWVKVKYQGKTGYMMSKYLQF